MDGWMKYCRYHNLLYIFNNHKKFWLKQQFFRYKKKEHYCIAGSLLENLYVMVNIISLKCLEVS